MISVLFDTPQTKKKQNLVYQIDRLLLPFEVELPLLMVFHENTSIYFVSSNIYKNLFKYCLHNLSSQNPLKSHIDIQFPMDEVSNSNTGNCAYSIQTFDIFILPQ